MSYKYEPWQLDELHHMSVCDPEAVESLLGKLWEVDPALFKSLALRALGRGALNADQCAAMLGILPEQCITEASSGNVGTVGKDTSATARLSNGVAVWEVIRELRRLGSLEELACSFPALTTRDFESALRYSNENAGEIDGLIRKYEDNLERRRSEFPFAVHAS